MKDKVVTITSSNGGILSNIFDLKSVTIFQGKVRVQIPVSHETLLNDQNHAEYFCQSPSIQVDCPCQWETQFYFSHVSRFVRRNRVGAIFDVTFGYQRRKYSK